VTTPYGDPAALRQGAANLLYRAEQIVQVAATLRSHLSTMTFAGPVADKWRSQMSEANSDLLGCAVAITNSAGQLNQNADLADAWQLSTGGMQ
jgi:hypothetical protein